MKGEDIKNTIRKIKADNRLIEKIKALESNEPKKLILRSEFWGGLAAACWVMLIGIFLFSLLHKKTEEPLLQNTHSISPIKTIITTESTPSITEGYTPTATEVCTPTPTAEPFTRIYIESKTLKIKLPEGTTKRENIEMVLSGGKIYVSVYNEITKLYRLYNIDKATGKLSSVSPEVNDLKIGKGFVIYSRDNNYYTNLYNWNREEILPINTENLIDMFIVSETSVVYSEKISGYTSYIRYTQYDIKTKESLKIYEITVHGDLIGGIPFALPEPLFVLDNCSILISTNKDKLYIYDYEEMVTRNIDIKDQPSVGIFDDVLYYTYGSSYEFVKIAINELDQYGRFKESKLEFINSSDGHLIIDGNMLFTLNINKLKGFFMIDLLTNEIYLLENLIIQEDDKLYVEDKQILIFDHFDTSSKTLSLLITNV